MMAKAKTETAKVMVLPRPGKARRTSAQAWIERTNPLTRLSLRAAQGIYDTARGGGYTRLQYIYAEIEKTDPTLFTCVDRRLSALSALGWRVVANVEGAEAEAQKKRLEEMLDGAVGLSAAIEHMGLAFFRGYSFCEPYMRDGRLAFNCPPSWEFNRSPDGTWWHNPLVLEGDAGGEGQTAFDPEAVIHVERVRAVDYPALALYLRHEVAEDEWGRFLERYGIPPVILEMPPLAQPGDADRFAQAAQQVYEALCGAVPNGTKVNTLAEARGADPFSAFIEHQEKTMVRLCTGGTLGSIAEATGIGSGASDAQGDVWREIVSRDAVLIGEEFTRWFGRYVFPEGMLVRFELGTEKRATPDEVFDTAAKARQAGYRFTKEYLETETGAELEADAGDLPGGTGAPGGGFGPGSAGRLPLLNKEPATPLQTTKDSLIDTQRTPRAPDNAILEAFAKDQGAAAEAVAKLLQNPTPDRAAALLKDLPNLLPEDPALAAVIAEEMAKAYGEAWEKARKEARPTVENKQDAQGNEHDDGNGQFTEKAGGSSGAPSETTEKPTHTPEQQKRIEEYQAAVDQKALAWREAVMQMDEKAQKKEFFQFGEADTRMAGDIKTITGIDTEGWPIKMQGNHAVHIDKRHGAQGKADHSMADPQDFARIGYAMKNYDDIIALPDNSGYRSKDNQPAKQVELRTRIDGTMAIQTVVPDTKAQTLLITSTRIEKAKG